MDSHPSNTHICANTHTHAQHTCTDQKRKKEECTNLELYTVIRNIDHTEENLHSLPQLSGCSQEESVKPKPAGFSISLP